MTRKSFWMFLEVELEDLMPQFERLFQLDNLYRDDENVWEWIETKDKSSEIYLNVSRSHDWEHGCYNEPINILIENNSTKPISEDEIGEKLFTTFKTTIFYGELVIETKDRQNYSAKVEKTFG